VKTPGSKLSRAKANQNTEDQKKFAAGGSGSTDELIEESGH